MGATSPYRVLGERPPADALRVLPVVEVRAPVVLSGNATFDDEDFATVRFVAEADDACTRAPSTGVPLWFYLVAGFTVSFGLVASYAMFWGR